MDNDASCDCRRLIGALEDEPLPDHVCPETMVDSVSAWIEQTWPGWAELHSDDLIDPLVPVDPPPGDGRHVGAPRDADGPQQGARVGFQPEWPLRHDGRGLLLVLRQWVHEDPNATLANMLAENSDWLAEVERYRPAFELWERLSEGRPGWLEAWIRVPDRVRRRLKRPGDHPDRSLAKRLRSAGIPDSPATLRHLRAVVAGRREPLPARGLLVETRIYGLPRPMIAPNGEHVINWVYHPGPEVSIGGALETVTAPLLTKALKIAVQHRNWCRKQIAQSSFTKTSVIRKAQRGSFALAMAVDGKSTASESDPRYDYVVEALKGADTVVQAALRPDADISLSGAISKYCDAVRRRVHKRRRNRGLPVATPEGWRETVAKAIRERIR